MANSKLLKEAIADAKAVRETAIANAKIALEEAFTPRLQSILSKKLQAEVEGDEEEVNEEYSDGSEAPTEDASDIGGGENKKPADDANDTSDLAKTNPDTEVDSAEVGKEDENSEVISEEEEADVPGEETSKIEEEENDEDELDLEAIIKELEDELQAEGDGEESEEEAPVAEEESEEEKEAPVAEEESEEEAPVAEEESEEEMHEEDEIDLDEILREMGYGDDEEKKDEVKEEEDKEDDSKVNELQSELEEAYKVIKSLKSTINEVNLLNAKLLYTNKLFRSYDLTNEQKHKVVETLDRTKNVREVKLVFSTLAESIKFGGTAKKVKQTKLTESFASKAVKSTAPKAEIIVESNSLAERFKQLANIK